jgi:prepilin-type N-terminal cleavage/methylation domain-containing protein
MRNYRAFTLIELLIAVSIMGILISVGILSYTGLQQRGRDAQRVNDVNQVKIALTTYYNAQVPTSYVVAATKTTINDSTDALSLALKPNYIKDLPLDPTNSGNNVYKYMTTNAGKNFTLYATLENKNNKKGWGGGNSWVTDGYQITDD